MTDADDEVILAFDPAEAVELAQELIQIPSPLWGESDLARWLRGWFAARSFDVDFQEVPLRDGRVSHQAIGILRGDGTGPSLMLCGHTDTSDWNGRPYREDEWTHDPYGGEVVGGVLYGLGAINMKAGLAANLVAADMVRRASTKRCGDLVVACVIAETGGGVGALHLIESGYRPNYCIVSEASNLDVGVISVGYVQGKIRILGEFKARVPYCNPIEKALAVVGELGPAYEPLTAKKNGGWIDFEPHPMLPGFPRLAVRDISHHQDVTTLTFDLRIPPGVNEESAARDLSALLDRIRVRDPEFAYELIIPVSEQQPNMPARAATSQDEPLVRELVRAHHAIVGVAPVVGAGHRIGATTDSSHFKGVGIQCIDYGPGFIPTWPMVDECIEVKQIMTATQVLALSAAALIAP